ncbi:MAG: hypothetical protein M3159_06870, partial [Actinomycetota bacterium]|nr:hypothetical protein [Actinomycetota bacterium]
QAQPHPSLPRQPQAPQPQPRRAPSPEPTYAPVPRERPDRRPPPLPSAGDAPRRWVSLVTIAGFGLVAIAGAQTIAWIVEGFAYTSNEPRGVPGDLLHRLGFPFLGTQSMVALLLLLVGLVLMSLPALLSEERSDEQEVLVRVTLFFTVAVAVVIAVGSVLAVRADLHVYAGQSRSVPRYVKIEMTTFLLGAIGTAAVVLFGAVAALGLHGERDPR